MTDPEKSTPSGWSSVAVPAAAAMVAFAANSVLARLALGGDRSDPATFTLLRVLSGAVVLALLAQWRSRREAPARGPWLAAGSWTSASMLVAYAAAFSVAYLRLGAAVGALVLFAVVQLVVFAAALRAGERPRVATWVGLGLALLGLVVLTAPGSSAPDATGAMVMALAGASWAGYTLRGRQVTSPIEATAANFVRGVPLTAVLAVVMFALESGPRAPSWSGVVYAVLSGAVASGVGYALWYSALPRLTRAQSGIIQLAPAPLAAIGGLAVIGEPITLRVALASVLILGGVALGIAARPARDRGARPLRARTAADEPG